MLLVVCLCTTDQLQYARLDSACRQNIIIFSTPQMMMYVAFVREGPVDRRFYEACGTR
jgi:hypothetical protein